MSYFSRKNLSVGKNIIKYNLLMLWYLAGAKLVLKFKKKGIGMKYYCNGR